MEPTSGLIQSIRPVLFTHPPRWASKDDQQHAFSLLLRLGADFTRIYEPGRMSLEQYIGHLSHFPLIATGTQPPFVVVTETFPFTNSQS